MKTTNAKLVMRFVTLGGAHVAVTQTEGGHTWNCGGCDQGDTALQPVVDARRQANDHAGSCRAIPKSTPAR
jgi:hypothetical protein